MGHFESYSCGSLMNPRFWPCISWSGSICHCILGKSLLEYGRNIASRVLYPEYIQIALSVPNHPKLKSWIACIQGYKFTRPKTWTLQKSDTGCLMPWWIVPWKVTCLEESFGMAPVNYLDVGFRTDPILTCTHYTVQIKWPVINQYHLKALSTESFMSPVGKKRSDFLHPVPTPNAPPAVACGAKSKTPKGSRLIQRLVIVCSDTLLDSLVTGRATGNVETDPKHPKIFFAS